VFAFAHSCDEIGMSDEGSGRFRTREDEFHVWWSIPDNSNHIPRGQESTGSSGGDFVGNNYIISAAEQGAPERTKPFLCGADIGLPGCAPYEIASAESGNGNFREAASQDSQLACLTLLHELDKVNPKPCADGPQDQPECRGCLSFTISDIQLDEALHVAFQGGT
jgi:hypothetical protein